ncbi:YodC family protein [Bosea thiooxidans]
MSIELEPMTDAMRGGPDFNVGDVVRLKSGGPAMTVEQTGGKAIRCAWFNGGGYNSGVFHLSSLERA